MVLVLLLQESHAQYDYYNWTADTRNQKSNWMASLSDYKRVTTLSIPGTHDSGARYGGVAVACQSLSIANQLKAGIRYLDIRLSYNTPDKKLYVYHGIFYQHIDLDGVLTQVINFLNNNPREAVFMRIKREDNSIDDRGFVGRFKKYMNDHGSHYFYTNSNVPHYLKEIRKKTVLIENVSGLPGIRWRAMPKQDNWDIKWAWYRWWKFEQVRDFMVKYKDDTSRLVINHSSGSSSLGVVYPYYAAKYVNYYLLDYLKQNDIRKTGIVAMDYPGDALINEIIKKNN